jgi:hypothetical protein
LQTTAGWFALCWGATNENQRVVPRPSRLFPSRVNIDTAGQIVLREWLMQASNEASDERLSPGNQESAASGHRKILVVCAIALAAIVVSVLAWLGVL